MQASDLDRSILSPNPLALDAGNPSITGNPSIHGKRRLIVLCIGSLHVLIDDSPGVQEPHLSSEQQSGSGIHRDDYHLTQESIGSIFRQNPLADNDYTFAKAPDGRYCEC